MTEKELAEKCWTPCKHYPKHCIGYCPFCVAELLQQKGEQKDVAHPTT